MGVVCKHFCDRCGCEMKYIGWSALMRGFRKTFIRELRNGNRNGHSYSDWDIELCADCTKELERFLRMGVYQD